MAKWLFIFSFFIHFIASSQVIKDSIPQREFKKGRFALAAGTGTAFYAGTLASLYTVWYQDNNWVGFHFTNDNADWKQIDKYGHAYTCYTFGKLGMQSLRWAGVKDKKAIIYGGSFGFLFMTSVEVLDGHYKEWGFSTMDMVSNASGALLLIGQELAFKKQVVTFKFSYHHTELAELRPAVLGEGFLDRVVQDYNGQTFWASTNLKSIFSNSEWLPSWLNVAPGYSAYGMLSSQERVFYDQDFNRLPGNHHQRQYFLSLDVDFEKINTNSKFLKSVFFFLNMIKVPLPTFELNSDGQAKFHAIYF